MIARWRARPRSRAARTCRRVKRFSRGIALVWHRIARLEDVGVAEAGALVVVAVGDLERPAGEPAEERDVAQRLGVPDQLHLRVLGVHRPQLRIGALGRSGDAELALRRVARRVAERVTPEGGLALVVDAQREARLQRR